MFDVAGKQRFAAHWETYRGVFNSNPAHAAVYWDPESMKWLNYPTSHWQLTDSGVPGLSQVATTSAEDAYSTVMAQYGINRDRHPNLVFDPRNGTWKVRKFIGTTRPQPASIDVEVDVDVNINVDDD